MVTSIRKGSRLHLYIQEWMDERGLSDDRLAGRLDVARQTVFRWKSEQHRLTPDKIADIAHALDLQPEELFRPPGRRSLDAITKDASEADFNAIVDFAERWVKRTGTQG